MGLLTKMNNKYELDETLSSYFEMPSQQDEFINFDSIKIKINELDIDYEEKTNIINKINTYNLTSSAKEKKELEKDINKFIKNYNI